MVDNAAPGPLGPRIRWLRKQRQMSQLELAQAVDVSQPTLSAYEHQTQTPPYPVVKRIALALNTTVGWLAAESRDPGHQLFPGTALTRRGIKLILQVHSIEEEFDADLIFAKLESLLKAELARVAIRQQREAAARRAAEQKRVRDRRTKPPPAHLMAV